MNNNYRKLLPKTWFDYYDICQADDEIKSGAYDTLLYTSKVLAEQLVRRCDLSLLTDILK